MSVVGLHHIGLTVRSIERSLLHYCGLLGFRQISVVEDSSPMIREVTGLHDANVRIADLVSEDGSILELVEYVAPKKPQYDLKLIDIGTAHISLRVTDIDDTYRKLLAASVVVNSAPVTLNAPGTMWHKARIVYSLDPDGRTVELIELPVKA
jgi:catechol 2,3-dioxygenase-like lactoylglutathione lyase family enzyme